ncbi:hypothetical protein [Rubritalea tangerina]|uniref:hypothetical protein n=1 Tax=Rubritalea tangerina TaxID=430798 RepID=UPI00361D8F48
MKPWINLEISSGSYQHATLPIVVLESQSSEYEPVRIISVVRGEMNGSTPKE